MISSMLNDCTLSRNRARASGGASGSTLNNCTLTGNSGEIGGAAYCLLNNCTLTGNSGGYGGGAGGSTLNNCTLSGNRAGLGGGAIDSTLNNCTLTGNSAWESGGGAYGSTLNNCVVYYNTAPSEANYSAGQLNYCCPTPLPVGGNRNIIQPPLFADSVEGNYRLQSNSPCISSGFNGYAPAGPDLDGNSRKVSGNVDIGAYEFQGFGLVISYAWLQAYGLPTDGSADYADPDGDSMNNWQEWLSLTNPTNVLSALRLLSPVRAKNGMIVPWQSVSTRSYWLERATDLGAPSPFQTVATNIVGVSGTKTFTDTSATNAGPYFYRVGVQ